MTEIFETPQGEIVLVQDIFLKEEHGVYVGTEHAFTTEYYVKVKGVKHIETKVHGRQLVGPCQSWYPQDDWIRIGEL